MDSTLNFKVQYSDTDAYKVAWHGSYLRWMEAGRAAVPTPPAPSTWVPACLRASSLDSQGVSQPGLCLGGPLWGPWHK